MFKVGDRVVYPMHGAGVIQSIEEKEILGELRKYYVMKLAVGDMKVMIPMGNAMNIGLRQVISNEKVIKVLEVLKESETGMSTNWNRRYRANLDKIKGGDIFEVAEVVKNLSLRDREKGLSTGERKMLENAKQILVSELVLAKETSEANIQNILDQLFA